MADKKTEQKAEKMNRAAEDLAVATRDSYKMVVDNLVALQERNVKFAQSWVENALEEYRNQAEANRATAQALVEHTRKQRDAFQALVQESVDAYMDYLYAPLAYYEEGLKEAGKVTK
ncbi:hypothetical protein E0L93_01915 [Rubrobacter taiwanensis]|jgi:uncharacterized membrane protein YqiK|uniref:Phasin family protein n=1 Tax=Rubrobacter taiwanensis TaxID=185139 RepID=A0A4R1BSD0_9ACTN|nr:hypothetical protein [Rubrobacter taiwanensis]TCJ20287.1 hypothetical protein E0L93_01915 [Rubrobacter taiwanensis]